MAETVRIAQVPVEYAPDVDAQVVVSGVVGEYVYGDPKQTILAQVVGEYLPDIPAEGVLGQLVVEYIPDGVSPPVGPSGCPLGPGVSVQGADGCANVSSF